MSWASRLVGWGTALLPVLLGALVLELLERGGWGISDVPAGAVVLLLLVVISTMIGGIGVGFLGAALASGYYLFVHSVQGRELSASAGSGAWVAVAVTLAVVPLVRASQRNRRLRNTIGGRTAKKARPDTAPEECENDLDRRIQQLKRMAVELTQAEQRERQKLAQTLHDNHQQLLVGAKMQAEMLRRLDPSQLEQRITKLVSTLEEAIASSRSLSYELSPPSLYSHGLAATLEWLAPKTEEKYGLTLHVAADPDADPQHEGVRVLMFQLARELLLNVVKHARTDEAWLRTRCTGEGELEMVVEDCGCGFEADQLGVKGAPAGLGLAGMRERLVLLDGEVSVKSKPGQGTRITLRVPLDAGKPHTKVTDLNTAASAETIASISTINDE